MASGLPMRIIGISASPHTISLIIILPNQRLAIINRSQKTTDLLIRARHSTDPSLQKKALRPRPAQFPTKIPRTQRVSGSTSLKRFALFRLCNRETQYPSQLI